MSLAMGIVVKFDGTPMKLISSIREVPRISAHH